jgi:hypothetical protein
MSSFTPKKTLDRRNICIIFNCIGKIVCIVSRQLCKPHHYWSRSDIVYTTDLTWYIYMQSIYRLIHGLFHIALVISTRPWYRPRGTISVEDWWQGQYEKGHVLIYLSHILPGQITCYCPRKMLLPRRQITPRKLCFYYTCKFGVISIKYVIKIIIYLYFDKKLWHFNHSHGSTSLK